MAAVTSRLAFSGVRMLRRPASPRWRVVGGAARRPPSAARHGLRPRFWRDRRRRRRLRPRRACDAAHARNHDAVADLHQRVAARCCWPWRSRPATCGTGATASSASRPGATHVRPDGVAGALASRRARGGAASADDQRWPGEPAVRRLLACMATPARRPGSMVSPAHRDGVPPPSRRAARARDRPVAAYDAGRGAGAQWPARRGVLAAASARRAAAGARPSRSPRSRRARPVDRNGLRIETLRLGAAAGRSGRNRCQNGETKPTERAIGLDDAAHGLSHSYATGRAAS